MGGPPAGAVWIVKSMTIVLNGGAIAFWYLQAGAGSGDTVTFDGEYPGPGSYQPHYRQLWHVLAPPHALELSVSGTGILQVVVSGAQLT